MTRGRYAPTPSGQIHVGNARTALVAWLAARKAGGAFVWRLEDLDGPRVVPGLAEAAERDLRWLGLDWDEGPGIGGPCAPYVQSERSPFYEAALDRLHGAGRIFPCRLSRADLKRLASAPHGPETEAPYPATLRPATADPDFLAQERRKPSAAIRFRVDAAPIFFVDGIQGEIVERVDQTVGDFVLRRRDGVWAYQLAVVVDDLAMAIDQVVRGADLLASTARQIQLITALGGRPPEYAHVPLVVSASGEKLSKRDHGLTLASLRACGVRPEALVGYLAFSLDLLERPQPVAADDLVADFDFARIGRVSWRLPATSAELAGLLLTQT